MAAKKTRRDVARSPEEKALKRDRILDATMKLCLEKGFAKTTMSDLAREMDIGKGTLYEHFRSKDELALSLIEREVDRMQQAVLPAIASSACAIEKLERMLRETVATYESTGDLLALSVTLAKSGSEKLDQQLLGMMRGVYRDFNAVVAALLEQGQREGDVRPEIDAEVAGAALVSLMDAMYVQYAFGLLPDDPERIAEALLSFVRDGYAQR